MYDVDVGQQAKSVICGVWLVYGDEDVEFICILYVCSVEEWVDVYMCVWKYL